MVWGPGTNFFEFSKSYPKQSPKLDLVKKHVLEKYDFSYFFEIVICYFWYLFIIVLIFRLKNRILHEKSYPKQSPKVNLVKFIFWVFF